MLATVRPSCFSKWLSSFLWLTNHQGRLDWAECTILVNACHLYIGGIERRHVERWHRRPASCTYQQASFQKLSLEVRRMHTWTRQRSAECAQWWMIEAGPDFGFPQTQSYYGTLIGSHTLPVDRNRHLCCCNQRCLKSCFAIFWLQPLTAQQWHGYYHIEVLSVFCW